MITILLAIGVLVLLSSLSATTLPTFTKTIDDTFTQTWYDIFPEAADNILNATVISAALKKKGCYKVQEGGNNVERSLEYATPPVKYVGKGDVLGSGETETRTAAFWDYNRNLSVHIQRSLYGPNGDRANRGKYQIVNYVAQRMERAIEAIKQEMEASFFYAHSPTEVGYVPSAGANILGGTAPAARSLYDLVPPVATYNTGTWGGINRPTAFTASQGSVHVPTTGNVWWTPRYMQLNADPEVNLLSDVKHFYNSVTDQIETPDLIVTSQNLFEIYLEFGLDQTQIVGDKTLLELGFSAAKYLDADFVWSKLQLTDDARFLNTRWIEIVYDPMCWFMLTDWEMIPGQLERICYCLVTNTGPLTNQPRRHGLLYT